MKPVEKVLGRLEGVVESEGVARFRIVLERSEESEVSVLTKIYALAMQKYQENEKPAEPAPEPDSCNDAAIVRNTEKVSHVEQRLDRPSDDHIASGTLAARVSDSQKYRQSISSEGGISSD
jgi:hypothetical protein